MIGHLSYSDADGCNQEYQTLRVSLSVSYGCSNTVRFPVVYCDEETLRETDAPPVVPETPLYQTLIETSDYSSVS